MKIIVNDANILIDLAKLDLIEKLSQLGAVLHTNDFVLSDCLHCFKTLLEEGLDLNYIDKNKLDYLVHFFSFIPIGNFDKTIDALIELGADVNTRDLNGKTPLIQAANSGGHKNMKVLIKKGADIFAKDNYGYTAMDYAKIGNHVNCQKLLIRAKTKAHLNK